MIQRLPIEGEGNLEGRRNEDDIGSPTPNRISILAAARSPRRAADLDANTILHRLFGRSRDLRRFEPQQPRFACTCSRELWWHAARPWARADDILAESGQIEIGCEFCGQRTTASDAVDVGQLFTPDHAEQAAGGGTLPVAACRGTQRQSDGRRRHVVPGQPMRGQRRAAGRRTSPAPRARHATSRHRPPKAGQARRAGSRQRR